VRQREHGLQEEVLLSRCSTGVKQGVQGVPQLSFDDSGWPMLSLRTLLILLTSYTKSVKNPKASQTQEIHPPILHLQTQL